MHREDDSNYLLYIEPTKEEKLIVPIDDYIVKAIEKAIERSKPGIADYYDLDDKGDFFGYDDAYKGWHTTDCGEKSSNNDYLLENGMITNSLAPFYLRYYRNSIPEKEMNKVLKLIKDIKDISMNEIETITNLLDLKDLEIKQLYYSWDKGDCSLVGIIEIYLFQSIKKHKEI